MDWDTRCRRLVQLDLGHPARSGPLSPPMFTPTSPGPLDPLPHPAAGLRRPACAHTGAPTSPVELAESSRHKVTDPSSPQHAIEQGTPAEVVARVGATHYMLSPSHAAAELPGYRVHGYRVQDLRGFRAQGSEFRTQGFPMLGARTIE